MDVINPVAMLLKRQLDGAAMTRLVQDAVAHSPQPASPRAAAPESQLRPRPNVRSSSKLDTYA